MKPNSETKSTNWDNKAKYNNNNKRNGNFNKRKNQMKFEPQFKKKTSIGQQIDDEVKRITAKYEEIDPSKINTFNDLPLSKRTLDGLKKANYLKPTEIQREAIPIALNGHDILGAAKTGSGKTLAFLIPILECLYRLKWNKLDGLGALIISPTRELAYQTFEVLKKVGFKHDFSAGLVIGGKDLKFESELIQRTSIIVCTPGRLLQHLDETYNFHCDNLKVLVLDEADRILDMGFSQTLNAIIENLPKHDRQTLLFSATQTKSISDLARLSLKNPTYVSVHENATTSTPDNLEQSYMICEAHEKLSFLWSFLRNHLDSKIIVFFQSCKQVKYAHEVCTKLGAGTNMLALYGTMNQLRRMDIYDQFCRKLHSVLFATDIAARGLDFPNINWVVQYDCPVDVNTYIHRVGRTARYEKDGQSLLLITKNESEFMLEEMKRKKITINEINVNKKFISNIDTKVQALCAENVELKESAKRAIMAYLKSLFLMNNKKLFDLNSIDLAKLSASFGLSIVPRIRFLQKSQKNNAQNNKSNTKDDNIESVDDDESTNDSEPVKVNKKLVKSNRKSKSNEDEDEDDLFTVRRVHNASDDDDDDEDNESDNTQDSDNNNNNKKSKVKVITKATIMKRLKKKNIVPNQKVVYDEEGEVLDDGKINKIRTNIDVDEDKVGGINIEKVRELLKSEDKYDKELYRKRIKEKHTNKRLKEKMKRREQRKKRGEDDEEDEGEVKLGTNDNDDDMQEEQGDESMSDDNSND